MKLLAFNSLYAPQFFGGAELVMQSRMEAVTKLGVNAKVVCLGTTDKSYEMNGIAVEQTRLQNIYWPFKDKPGNSLMRALWHSIDAFNPVVFAKITRLLKKEKPDLIETSNIQGFSPSVWLAAHRLGIPILHHMQDHYLMCPAILMAVNGKICDSRCTSCQVLSAPKKSASSLVSAVTAVSNDLLNRHLEAGYFSSAKVREAFPNWIRLPSWVEKKPIDPQAPLTFGFLGRVMLEKGIEVAIKSLLSSPNKNWTLLVAGSGLPEYVAYLCDQYKDSRIQFLGPQPSEAFLRRIDLLLVPSLYREPSARVLIESLAAGVPVMGFNRGGTPELARPGETGYVVSSEEEFESQLHYLVSNPGRVRALSQSSRAFAAKLSEDIWAPKLVSLYEKVLSVA